MKIHIAIYSPKSSGILSAAIDLQAEKVIVLHRAEDEVSGIKSAIQSRGMQCETHKASFDAQAFRQLFNEITNTFKTDELYFNASSGYRKMVLLGHEQSYLLNISVFMVDKFTNTLHWLNQDNQRHDHVLGSLLKISEYLKLFNTHVISTQNKTPETQRNRSVTEWIIRHLNTHLNEISSLNHIAMMANAQHKAHLNGSHKKNTRLMELLRELEQAGQLRIKDKQIIFTDAQSRFFCNGGWLENHVFAQLYGIRARRPTISDIDKSMVITRANGKVKNEIDVVAMANNRLHVIECKTSKIEKKNSNKSNASSAIYRLDTLKSIAGGLSGKAMLISFQPLSKHTLIRAKDLGIYCCSHTQLTQLKDHLYRFLDQDIQ